MPVDLNEVANRLLEQRNLGVNRNGQLLDRDPRNDGSRVDEQNPTTTLKPQRFYNN